MEQRNRRQWLAAGCVAAALGAAWLLRLPPTHRGTPGVMVGTSAGPLQVGVKTEPGGEVDSAEPSRRTARSEPISPDDRADSPGAPHPPLLFTVAGEDGRPVPGAILEVLFAADPQERTTDPGGRASFPAWPSATFTVVVTTANPADPDSPPFIGRELSFDPGSQPKDEPLRIELAQAARVKGSLHCSDGSSPRSSGIDIYHVASKSWSNAAAVEDGSFMGQWMPPGDVILYARNGTWTEVDLRLRRQLALASGQTHAFHGSLEPARELTGTTVDLAGLPAPGCAVELVETDNPGHATVATSGPAGEFSLTGLYHGAYRLRALGAEPGTSQDIIIDSRPGPLRAAPIVIGATGSNRKPLK